MRIAVLLPVLLAGLACQMPAEADPPNPEMESVGLKGLEGLWESQSGGKRTWFRFDWDETDHSYSMGIFEQPKQEYIFTATVVSIGGFPYLDTWPLVNPHSDTSYGALVMFSHLVKAHGFWSIDIHGDEMVLAPMSTWNLHYGSDEDQAQGRARARESTSSVSSLTPEIHTLLESDPKARRRLFSNGVELTRISDDPYQKLR